MTFSIEKEKLPNFSKQSFEVITLELGRFDDESVWEIDWEGEFSVTYPGGCCWVITYDEFNQAQMDELDKYIATHQAEIDAKAELDRIDDKAHSEWMSR
jgi:hypothetical protein